jgi:hypothetical protein
MQPEPSRRASLATLQQRFADALFDMSPASDALAQFQGDADSVGRLIDFYRGNLGAHWEKSLAGAYPVLKAQVGEEFFGRLARLYGRARPSQCGDLNRFGEQLARFLGGFEPVAQYPWFPELAELEWAVHSAHYAADAPALKPESVAALDPGALEEMKIGLHPACALLDSRWNVVAVWQAHQAKPAGEWREQLERPVRALVYRPRWRVEVREPGTAENVGLRALQSAKGLGEAMEAVAGADPGCDIGALFGRWLADGLLVSRSNC